MHKFLKRVQAFLLLPRVRLATSLSDRWWQTHGYYINSYRKQLKSVARRLFLRMRFNASTKCAEFYTFTGNIIATVEVRGSECVPCGATVTLLSDAPKNKRGIFTRALTGLHVDFKEMSPAI